MSAENVEIIDIGEIQYRAVYEYEPGQKGGLEIEPIGESVSIIDVFLGDTDISIMKALREIGKHQDRDLIQILADGILDDITGGY